MFRASSAHLQEVNDVNCICMQSLVLPSYRTQHDYHHDTKIKTMAATAVFELLMMGSKTPKTC
jgi:hypothetical protein